MFRIRLFCRVLIFALLAGCSKTPPPLATGKLENCFVIIETTCPEEPAMISLFGEMRQCGGQTQSFSAHVSAILPERNHVSLRYDENRVLPVPIDIPPNVDAQCTVIFENGKPPNDEVALRHFHKLKHPWGLVHNPVEAKAYLPSSRSTTVRLTIQTHPEARVTLDGSAIELDAGVGLLPIDLSEWALDLPFEEFKARLTRQDDGLVSFSSEWSIDILRTPLTIKFPDGTSIQPEISLISKPRMLKNVMEQRLLEIRKGRGLAPKNALTDQHWALRENRSIVPIKYIPQPVRAREITRYAEINTGELIGDGKTCSYVRLGGKGKVEIVQKIHAALVSIYDASTGEKLREHSVTPGRGEPCRGSLTSYGSVNPDLKIGPTIQEVISSLGI